MKLLIKAALLVAVFLSALNNAWSQSGNSNIGTEFWTGYMDHISGASPTGSQMILYIASDVSTSGTVAINDNSFSAISFTVVPNVATLVPIPATAFLGNTNGLQNKGIHITSVNPIAVYAHIYASSVSGATLLLPVNTMANDYYSLNYTQLSNATPSYSTFMVVGTEDGTSVQITPSAALIDGSAANKTFTITLNKGQVYQGISNTDLTGTHVISVSTATTACKKIAMFSGSNKIYIGKPNTSADNLFQQVYPTASWGKNYITVPLKSRNYDVYRIVLSNAATKVTLNGAAIPLGSFTNGLYYQFNSQTTNVITADQPIQVVQYAVTQGNTIAGTTLASDIGDPEMIFLNPLEQNIDHVTLYSTDKYKILNGFINVVVPAAAASSFLLDGVSQASSFVSVPGNSLYSFAQLTVAVGATHVISASQGFNAIAYGFGSTESYGYAAGTNVKNLNEYVQYADPKTSQAYTSSCAGTSFNPQVVIPYPTTSITWDFGNGSTPVVQASPTYKSTFVKNGVQLYLYDYGTPVTYTSAGTYPVKVTVVDPITTVCGSNEEIDLNYQLSNPPTALFNSRDSVCVSDTIGFTDKSAGNGSAIQSWKWNFGNGDTSIVQKPVYKYLKPGDYTVSLTVTIAAGCQSMYTKNVHVRTLPVAAFGYSTPDCQTQTVTLIDQSKTAEGNIVQWIWNYGDGTAPETRTNGQPFTHTYAKAGTDTIKLQIITDKGCYSSSVSHTILVHPQPVVAFGLPDVCLINSTAKFTDKTTIADNSNAQFKYLWTFGDAQATTANPNTSTLQSPTHLFTQAGVYTVSLMVTSKDSCAAIITNTYTVSGQANFTAPATACPADTIVFADATDPSGKVESAWHWDFGNKDTSALQNPKYAYALSGDYTVKLTVTGHNGCSTTSYSQPIHINKRPLAAFGFSGPECETQSVTFTDASTSAEGKISQWIWNYGDGTAAETRTTNAPFAHVFAKAGTDTVKLQVVTAGGCLSLYASHVVTIHPHPVVAFSLPDVCLVNSTAQFTDKTTIADNSNAQFKYTWNFGDAQATVSNPNTATIKNPAHKYTKAGTYVVSLTVTSKDTCTVTATNTYTVSGQANFTAASSACPADSVVFTDKTDGTNKIVSAWHWSFGDGDTSAVQNPKHAFKASGNYTVSLTVSGHNGCSTTSYSQSIHINQKPVANFAYSSPDCATQTITFTDKSTSAEGTVTAWIWDFGDGSATSSLQNPTHAFSPSKTYVVTLTVTSSFGCSSAPVSQTVIVNPLPVPDFTLPDVCLSDAAAIFVAIPDKNGLIYTWDFGDVPSNISAKNPNTATGLTVIHKYNSLGAYNAKLTVTTTSGCMADTVKQFYVNGSSPQAAFAVVNPTTLCSSRDVFFVDNANVPGFGNGNVTSIDMYYDYVNNPTVKTHYARPSQGQVLRHTYPVIYSGTQNYKVHMVAYSGTYPTTTCQATYDQVVTLLPVPVVTFKTDSQVCVNAGPVLLSSGVTVQKGPTGTPVFIIDGKTSPDGYFYPSVSGLGKHVVECLYTSPNTCADTLQQNITVEPIATVTTVYNQLILAGGQVKLQATATGSNLTYRWSPAKGLSQTNILEPVASPSVETKYTLTVTSTTSGTACAVTDSVLVKVLQAPIIPSAFTPNNDGVNDTWNIQYLDTYPGCTVEVYNRNGEKLFASIGYNTPWDGKYNNAVLPVGVYYYIIDPKHGRTKISGSVTIIR